ncbi:MAG: 1,6-anhydro-N-acetylmuramyl-L-alanine amidase AmpD [Burkholderiales bacterium]|nr:1,6-anhydro-N-acetylmuramyl-L-alanine amidase AmpD [Burkholderiales bacterium]
MFIADDGLIEDIRQLPSPNYDERPADARIELLVIHNISLPPGEFGGPGIVDLFTNRLDPAAHPYYAGIAGRRVSAHVLIRRDGAAIQFVSCAKRAWHAGVSAWCGRERCNDFSIGIELEGTDDVPFTPVQYEQLAQLTRALKARYPIAGIVGHSDIAPGRKTDPGPCFDWPHYRALIAD